MQKAQVLSQPIWIVTQAAWSTSRRAGSADGNASLSSRIYDRPLEPGALQETDCLSKVVGAEDDVDVAGPLLDELPVLLGQAAADGDLHFGPPALERLEVAEVPVEFVVGVLPDAAGVEHDEIGLVGGAGRLHALLREQPGQALRVVLVHLAPEGPDPEALASHLLILRTSPSNRPPDAAKRPRRGASGTRWQGPWARRRV